MEWLIREVWKRSKKGYWINYYWTLFIQNEIKTME
nr:MAG TPA: hypothetical protein [Caudoviricetes sp.]